jgi:excisionase family DNA binding protein
LTDYLKIPELATRLDVSQPTVRRMVKSGKLPSVFVGGAYRVSEEDLEEYLEKARVEPSPKAVAPQPEATTTGKASAPPDSGLTEAERLDKLRGVGENARAIVDMCGAKFEKLEAAARRSQASPRGRHRSANATPALEDLGTFMAQVAYTWRGLVDVIGTDPAMQEAANGTPAERAAFAQLRDAAQELLRIGLTAKAAYESLEGHGWVPEVYEGGAAAS